MNKGHILLVFLLIGIFSYCVSLKKDSSDLVKKEIQKNIRELKEAVDAKLLNAAQKGDVPELQKAFLAARLAYKRIEWATEYYAPGTSRHLNGAPLPEIEVEETKTFEPAGLQVIEGLIFPFDKGKKKELIKEINVLSSKIKLVENVLNEVDFTEAHILQACKYEVFRVISLGLSGFDAPLAKSSIPEAKIALQAVLSATKTIGRNPEIEGQVANACKYLDEASDFDSFNRMEFIIRFANPLTRELKHWQDELKIKPLETEQALYNNAETLFDRGIFNENFFAESNEARFDSRKAKLGEQLFSSPTLSGANRTCQSCHNPELAFTDGLAKSPALTPGTFVKRNAPTLYYAGLQQAQFYDMRSPSLENQAMDVIANKDEMHASVEEAAQRLNKQAAYKKKFKLAFPDMDKEIRPRYIMIAIASYIRSLAPFNSRFDKYMRGDYKQMNREELAGFNLFMGKAKCGTCHFMPVFNGTAPPTFTTTESEVLGVPSSPNASLDSDSGRYSHNKIEELKFSFKTPTLRNIGITAPYMHNGVFKSLAEVLNFYNVGGGAGLGMRLENQTLPTDSLKLSNREKSRIIAFLKTLTDNEKAKEHHFAQGR